MAALFPQLADHLGRAEPMGSQRGAISISTKLAAVMERLLLLMDGSDGFRRRALRAVAARPTITRGMRTMRWPSHLICYFVYIFRCVSFSRLLAVHVGALRPWEASFDVFDFALRLLASRTDRAPYSCYLFWVPPALRIPIALRCA
jgi:hypothetical protein